MNDTAQNQNGQAQQQEQNQTQPQAPIQQQQTSSPVRDQQPAGQVQTTPQQGQVGSLQKEAAPLPSQATEFVKPSEVAPQLDQELKEAGVEATPDAHKPNLTLADKKAGLGLAKEHVEVSTQPSGNVTLPMTPEEAAHTVKTHRKMTDSVRWLAMLILKQLKQQPLKKE